MADDYTNYWKRRVQRRTFLGGATALGAGAAGLALVGCGDDDSSSNGSNIATPTAGANPTAKPVDPFANAKRGGTMRFVEASDPPSLDPYGSASFLTKVFASHPYSRLFKLNAGPGVKDVDVVPVPDLAEKAEIAPDALSATVTLRTDVKFHNVAPVNGRALTTDDIAYSWKRMIDPKNATAAQMAYIDTVTFPDTKTAKFTFKTPNAAFLESIADANLLWIMPKEADSGGFDPTKTMIGTGPWMFDSYTPSTSLKFKKNPSWHNTGFPLMDAIEWDFIADYANRRSQFLAGSLDGSDVTNDDLIDVKNQVKDVQLYGVLSALLSFFYFDNDPTSPWNKDTSGRVRQAISMAIDRDGMTELLYNIKKLNAAGLNIPVLWNNIIPAGMTKFWLDPKGTDIGDSGKYFKYDVAGAKALLSAAGYPNGFETPLQWPATVYGATFETAAQANVQYLQAINIKSNVDEQNYTAKYFPQTFAGNFKGMAFGYETPFPEGGSYPIRYFTPNTNNHGHIDDPDLKALAFKQQAETDPVKRKAIMLDIQKQHAAKMYYIPNQAGSSVGFTMFQSWLKNAIDIATRPSTYAVGTETTPYLWKDGHA
jgi:peptide/nickel transport system substrate-binding protein